MQSQSETEGPEAPGELLVQVHIQRLKNQSLMSTEMAAAKNTLAQEELSEYPCKLPPSNFCSIHATSLLNRGHLS
jgi:hypothetical protein